MDVSDRELDFLVYHGTVEKFLSSILKDGLKKMNRHHVHLSKDIATAVNVGGRRGEAIILEVNSGAMYADKIKFYESTTGVWLVDEVPSKYIKIHES